MRAAVLRLEPGDDAQQRRLAAADGPRNTMSSPRATSSAIVLQRVELAEALVDAVELRYGASRSRGASRRQRTAPARPARRVHARYFGFRLAS
jgi:hypothetical protein